MLPCRFRQCLGDADTLTSEGSSERGKLNKKCCCRGLGSVWNPLTHCLPKGVLKQELLGIQVTIFFGVKIFQNS